MNMMKIGPSFAVAVLVLGVSLASAQVYLTPSNNDDAQRSIARRAAVKAAQGEVDRAQATLDAANARIKANWNANADHLAAEKDLATRQAAFEKARAPLMDKLRQNPEYRAALSQTHEADATVKQEQSAAVADRPATTQPGASPTTLPLPSDTQVQAATEKLEHKSVLRDMEAQAIAADPTAFEAQRDLDLARDKMKALNLEYEAARLNDPDYKASLDQLNAAKSRLTAATAQY